MPDSQEFIGRKTLISCGNGVIINKFNLSRIFTKEEQGSGMYRGKDGVEMVRRKDELCVMIKGEIGRHVAREAIAQGKRGKEERLRLKPVDACGV